jgi:RimJ/RimL family protein N-acetyltransferase
MPVLTTNRLHIRPFVMGDLDSVHNILDLDSQLVGGADKLLSREERQAWLEWSIGNHEHLGKLFQPPYGDKAIALRDTDEVIGVCGFVPCLGPFSQLPSLRDGESARARYSTPEVGLFYAVSRNHRGRGYASEAARALVDYAFRELKIPRIIATTTYDNAASVSVMHSLGMIVDHNPYSDPPWLQVVGVLENPD